MAWCVVSLVVVAVGLVIMWDAYHPKTERKPLRRKPIELNSLSVFSVAKEGGARVA